MNHSTAQGRYASAAAVEGFPFGKQRPRGCPLDSTAIEEFGRPGRRDTSRENNGDGAGRPRNRSQASGTSPGKPESPPGRNRAACHPSQIGLHAQEISAASQQQITVKNGKNSNETAAKTEPNRRGQNRCHQTRRRNRTNPRHRNLLRVRREPLFSGGRFRGQRAVQ